MNESFQNSDLAAWQRGFYGDHQDGHQDFSRFLHIRPPEIKVETHKDAIRFGEIPA
jgi:hypothetical protein